MLKKGEGQREKERKEIEGGFKGLARNTALEKGPGIHRDDAS